MRSLIIASLLLGGCVSQGDVSPERRALAMQYLMGHQNPVQLYQLPMPQPRYTPPAQTYNCVQNYGSGPSTYACQSQ